MLNNTAYAQKIKNKMYRLLINTSWLKIYKFFPRLCSVINLGKMNNGFILLFTRRMMLYLSRLQNKFISSSWAELPSLLNILKKNNTCLIALVDRLPSANAKLFIYKLCELRRVISNNVSNNIYPCRDFNLDIVNCDNKTDERFRRNVAYR